MLVASGDSNAVMDDLDDLAHFALVAEHGGFAAAERATAIPKSRLSRRLALLEARLGTRLIQRSTRRFAVTPMGEQVLQHARAMLAEAEAARALVDEQTRGPRGTVRLACPPALLQTSVGALLARFLNAWPQVQLQVQASNRNVDVWQDGVDLALKHKLPRTVIDVIQQHHGTTLIRYFFQRAVQELARPAFSKPGSPEVREHTNVIRADPSRVCETTYRYDGPKPQFKESAIIHLADMCEAASRSMRKVTPQHLSELIEQIFRASMADGQLDESPLTFEEITKIKSSFNFTLLNMLHSRVAYPPSGTALDSGSGSGSPPPRAAHSS